MVPEVELRASGVLPSTLPWSCNPSPNATLFPQPQVLCSNSRIFSVRIWHSSLIASPTPSRALTSPDCQLSLYKPHLSFKVSSKGSPGPGLPLFPDHSKWLLPGTLSSLQLTSVVKLSRVVWLLSSRPPKLPGSHHFSQKLEGGGNDSLLPWLPSTQHHHGHKVRPHRLNWLP